MWIHILNAIAFGWEEIAPVWMDIIVVAIGRGAYHPRGPSSMDNRRSGDSCNDLLWFIGARLGDDRPGATSLLIGK